MKRDFLANLKVGETPLDKTVIDAIMQENGKDIEAAKAPYADYETVKTQLEEAKTTIADFKANSGDIETVKAKAAEWEQKYNQAISDHKKAMADRDFNDRLNTAISGANGKNAKAIMALLDVDTLRESKNQDVDIKSAIEQCQKDNDYLFDSGSNPPPMPGGTGSGNGFGGNSDSGANISHDAYGSVAIRDALFGSK